MMVSSTSNAPAVRLVARCSGRRTVRWDLAGRGVAIIGNLEVCGLRNGSARSSDNTAKMLVSPVPDGWLTRWISPELKKTAEHYLLV
ncbi:MAG: hypothetical protein OEM32_08970 [Acidimicrobiia bacterium]|nr:hypothetical protein [Acidimicrobiia bacterium]